MPFEVNFDDKHVENHFVKTTGTFMCATEEELLDFANILRAAGHADPLEALLPSKPGKSHTCLIANALNFSSRVLPKDGVPPKGGRVLWRMYLPDNMEAERVVELAEAVGCTYVLPVCNAVDSVPYRRPYINLPAEIGNAADAFDARLAFTDFIDSTD